MNETPEFSRLVPIDSIGAGATSHTIEANAAECAALAERFELEAIDSLSAEAEVWRDGSAIYAKGVARALVTQSCVATGNPVSNRVDPVLYGGAFTCIVIRGSHS